MQDYGLFGWGAPTVGISPRGYGLPTDEPQALVSSPFGQRSRPTAGASAYHAAIDVVGPAPGAIAQSNAVSVAPGVVSYAGPKGGYGNTVEVTLEDGKVARYSHLDSIDVEVGTPVSIGQPVGRIGNTGISTGAHLDFGVTNPQGQRLDPMDALGYTFGDPVRGYPSLGLSAPPTTPDPEAPFSFEPFAEPEGLLPAPITSRLAAPVEPVETRALAPLAPPQEPLPDTRPSMAPTPSMLSPEPLQAAPVGPVQTEALPSLASQNRAPPAVSMGTPAVSQPAPTGVQDEMVSAPPSTPVAPPDFAQSFGLFSETPATPTARSPQSIDATFAEVATPSLGPAAQAEQLASVADFNTAPSTTSPVANERVGQAFETIANAPQATPTANARVAGAFETVAEQPTATPTVTADERVAQGWGLFDEAPEVAQSQPEPVAVAATPAPAVEATPAPAQAAPAPAQAAPAQAAVAQAQPAPTAPAAPQARPTPAAQPAPAPAPSIPNVEGLFSSQPTVAGLAPSVSSNIEARGIEAPEGMNLGYSPYGGVAAVSPNAPESVQVAATGPGLFGAIDDEDAGIPGLRGYGQKAEQALASQALATTGGKVGGAVGALGGTAVGGPVGGLVGGLLGGFIGNQFGRGLPGMGFTGLEGASPAAAAVAAQNRGLFGGMIDGLGNAFGGGSGGGVSEATASEVGGLDASGRGGLW